MYRNRFFLPSDHSRRHQQFRECQRHDLYLMGAFLDDTLLAYKIGISYDFEKRRIDLERGSFAKVFCLCYYRCSCKGIAVYLEDVCIKDLRRHRLRGEWFRPVSEVKDRFETGINEMFHRMHDGDVHRCG